MSVLIHCKVPPWAPSYRSWVTLARRGTVRAHPKESADDTGRATLGRHDTGHKRTYTRPPAGVSDQAFQGSTGFEPCTLRRLELVLIWDPSSRQDAL